MSDPNARVPPQRLTLTERWRPKSLSDVVGQWEAVRKLREFAAAWRDSPRPPPVRVAVLEGPSGSGKTSAGLALATDMGWGAVEMNASDARNEGALSEVAGRASLANTFTEDGRYLSSARGERNLILIDEADSLSSTGKRAAGARSKAGASSGKDVDDRERSVTDEGGMSALARLVATTRQPVVLTVNDAYPLFRAGVLKRGQAARIRFYPVDASATNPWLRRIATAEHMVLTVPTLDAIVARSNGDLRAALNDLEAMGGLPPGTDPEEVLGERALESNLFEATKRLLLSGRFLPSVEIMSITDASPDDVWPWIEENLPKFAPKPTDLYAGFEMLARGQMHLARANRWRIWTLWSYANEMFAGGVSTAIHHGASPTWYGSPQIDFPSVFSSFRGAHDRGTARQEAVASLSNHVHMSRRRTLGTIVPLLKGIHRSIEERDDENLTRLRAWEDGLAQELDLPPEDVSVLLDQPPRGEAPKRTARKTRKTVTLDA